MDEIEKEKLEHEQYHRKCVTELARIHGSLDGCIAVLSNTDKWKKDIVDEYIACKIGTVIDIMNGIVKEIEELEPRLKRRT